MTTYYESGKDISFLKFSLSLATSELDGGGELNGSLLLLTENDRCGDNFELC